MANQSLSNGSLSQPSSDDAESPSSSTSPPPPPSLSSPLPSPPTSIPPPEISSPPPTTPPPEPGKSPPPSPAESPPPTPSTSPPPTPSTSPPPTSSTSPPPTASTSPPPKSSTSPSPTSSTSPPPTPSTSPPPTPSTSPPPTPSTSPPPTPSTSPPPTSSTSPPPTPSTSPPPTSSTSPPPTPSTSPPPSSIPSPPPQAQTSPPPKYSPPSPPPPLPSRSAPPPPRNSPRSPQSHAPPPQSLPPPTPPSPVSRNPPPPSKTFVDPSMLLSPGLQPESLPGLPPGLPPIFQSKPTVTISKNPSKASRSSSGNNTGEIVGLALAGVFIIAFLALVIFFIFMRRNKRMNIYPVQHPRKFHMKGGVPGGDVHYYVEEPGFVSGAQQGDMNIRSPSDPVQHMGTGLLVFTYEKLAEITDGFSSEHIIGQGGFGYVYKASMPDGRVGALKMLKTGSGQGEREFRAEVEIISRIHHRHLVSLIGYCVSEQERVLIYEFVPNGNLNQHLHGTEWPILDWSKRMRIAVGAARGLSYLHDGCNPKIIHRDIKSANILLGNACEAQVADFGLARLTDDANTHVSTRVMGTFGYMAPEYATSGKLTDRSDVFSFGVVLLELITGRKPVDSTQPIGEESLVEWARPLLISAVETREFAELVDPRLEKQYIDNEMFKMIEAAAACVRHSAPKRPRMVQVVRALDHVDHLCNLSNGVRYGQSIVYDSGQYIEDNTTFRKMVNGSFDDSDFDKYSLEYPSTFQAK